jgi:hypothetical protein
MKATKNKYMLKIKLFAFIIIFSSCQKCYECTDIIYIKNKKTGEETEYVKKVEACDKEGGYYTKGERIKEYEDSLAYMKFLVKDCKTKFK